ncbi:MAG TPA: hypothetical protein VHD90_08785, partial [Phototrophicaceae bacterium]|nr:hypothetical protein [Phototrophicaceae bacterium]
MLRLNLTDGLQQAGGAQTGRIRANGHDSREIEAPAAICSGSDPAGEGRATLRAKSRALRAVSFLNH